MLYCIQSRSVDNCITGRVWLELCLAQREINLFFVMPLLGLRYPLWRQLANSWNPNMSKGSSFPSANKILRGLKEASGKWPEDSNEKLILMHGRLSNSLIHNFHQF